MATQLVTDSLAFNWDFADFTSGGTSWVDRVGGKTLTIASGAQKSDDGVEFTSSNSFYSENLGLDVAYPLSFEWIGRLDSFNTGNLWGLGSVSGNWSYSVTMYSKVTNCIIDNGATQTGITSTGLLHFVVVFTSSTAWTIYYTQGGAQTGDYSSTSGTSSLSSNSKNYLFNNEGSNRLIGAISKMRIWTKALSTEELDKLFTEFGEQTPTRTESSTTHGTYYGDISNVTDGDTSTYWWSNDAQTAGTYIQFDFSKKIIFHGLRCQTLNNTSDCVSSGTLLQVSTDGENWTTVGTFDGTADVTFTGIDTKCTSVRLYAATASNQWLCINEITLDYDAVPESLLRAKLDGTWYKINYIYKKVDGAWTLVDETAIDRTLTYVHKN